MAQTRCPACSEAIDATLSRCPACGGDVAQAKRIHRFSVGDLIDGKFEVVELLPAGGMGELYKVRHRHLNDFRVVKVLRADRTTDDARLRFAREAKIAAGVQHPNLAAIYDFSSLSDGSFYMVEEFIDGVTIAQHLRDGYRFTLGQTLRVGEEVLGGLVALHERGIVHRDISPENLMITRSSTGSTIVKIIDLGIAKPIEGQALTTAGVFVGKPHYASPEQLRIIETNQSVDHRTDLYSLGVVLYEMLTGHIPYDAPTPVEYAIKQMNEEIRTLNPPGPETIVPAEIDAFIVKLLRSRREERYSSAEEALAALREIRVRFPSFRDSTLSRFFPSALRADRAATEPTESLWEEPSREMEPTVVDDNADKPMNEADDSKTEVVPLAQLKSAMNTPAPPAPPEEGATQVVPLAQLRSAISDAQKGQQQPIVEPMAYEPPPSPATVVEQPPTVVEAVPAQAQAATVVERVPQFELDEPGANAPQMPTIVEPSAPAPDEMRTMMEQATPPPAPDAMRTMVEETPSQPESLRTYVEPAPPSEPLRTIVEEPVAAAPSAPSPFINPAAEGLVLPMAAAASEPQAAAFDGASPTVPLPKFTSSDFTPPPMPPVEPRPAVPGPDAIPAQSQMQPQIPIMRDLAAESAGGRTVAEGVYPPFPVAPAPAPAPLPAATAYAPMPKPQKGGAGVKIFVLLLLLVVFLGLIGGGVLAYRMYGSKISSLLNKQKTDVAESKPVVTPPPPVVTQTQPVVQTQSVAPIDTAVTATNFNTAPLTATVPTTTIPPLNTTTQSATPQTTKSKKPATRKPQQKKKPEPVIAQPREILPPPPPPEPTVREGDLVAKGPGVTDARVNVYPPEYPEQAKRGRAEGLVRVSVLVNQFGKIDDMRVAQSSGNRYLDDAAMKAARKSSYTPATKNGVRVKIWKTLEFVFKMP